MIFGTDGTKFRYSKMAKSPIKDRLKNHTDSLLCSAFSDIRRFTDWRLEGVRIRPTDEQFEEDAAAVTEISVRKDSKRGGDSTTRSALFAIVRYLGLFEKYSWQVGNLEFCLKAPESGFVNLRP